MGLVADQCLMARAVLAAGVVASFRALMRNPDQTNTYGTSTGTEQRDTACSTGNSPRWFSLFLEQLGFTAGPFPVMMQPVSPFDRSAKADNIIMCHQRPLNLHDQLDRNTFGTVDGVMLHATLGSHNPALHVLLMRLLQCEECTHSAHSEALPRICVAEPTLPSVHGCLAHALCIACQRCAGQQAPADRARLQLWQARPRFEPNDRRTFFPRTATKPRSSGPGSEACARVLP